MKNLFVLTILVLGFQMVHADESPTVLSEPREPAASEEAKSFFETRTLEDLQQLVHFDAQAFESTEQTFGEG